MSKARLHAFLVLVMVAFCASASSAQAPTASTPRRLTKIINSYPSPSPDGKRIVFQSNRSGRSQIYSMNLDGTAIRQLTNTDGVCSGPSYSPDGKQILLACGSDQWKTSDVYLMNADGSNLHALTTGGIDNSHPHWAPDGARIIFNSSRTTPEADRADPRKEQDDIFSMNPDGTDLRQHTHCGTICTYATFSPDLKKIAYRKVTNTPGLQWDLTEAKRNSEVVIADADGSNEVNLTNNAAFDGWPMFSPDGKQVAFASNRSGPANTAQIYVVNADGTGLRRISSPPGSYAQPSWSADGTKIYAYNNIEVGDDEWGDIVVVDVISQSTAPQDQLPPQPSAPSASQAAVLTGQGLSTPKRVTKLVEDTYPMLSPDGAKIVFSSNRTGKNEIFTINPDGTFLQQLTHTPYEVGGPIWSPDGKKILYGAEIPGEEWEVFVMNADGTGNQRLTQNRVSDGHAHWSPDGKTIIFNSSRATPDPTVGWSAQWHDIYLMNADGADVRKITSCKSVCTYGVISPDGRKIAFRQATRDPGLTWEMVKAGRNSEVFVSNLDGSQEVNVSRSPAYDGWPMWSPDGKWILFSSNRNGTPTKGDLFVVHPDGSNLLQVSQSAESLVQPSWSADGTTIYAAQYTLDEESSVIVALKMPIK